MKLYFFPIAPNPTRVRLYLAEKAAAGFEFPIEEVSVNLATGEQKSPEHLARNPQGNLPVLELDDGTYLTESRVIMAYLEELQPEPTLIGHDLLRRARVMQLERIAEQGVLLPIAMIVHSSNSPLGLAPIPEMAAFYRDRLVAPLGMLDECLRDGRPFVAGDAPTIADCTLAAALQFGRFRDVTIDPAFEHVLRWDRDYRDRDIVAGVLLM